MHLLTGNYKHTCTYTQMQVQGLKENIQNNEIMNAFICPQFF